MKNWRGYFGVQEIEFSTNPNKPVTVVIADNRIGKSDILRAIHWVLYDEVPAHTKKSKDLINNFAESLDKNAYAEVNLELSNDDDTYRLTRVLDIDLDKSNAGSRFFVDILTSGNVWEPFEIGKNERNWINANFLPDHLKHIFLFQGEVLANTFENENEDEINAAVKNVTGTNYVSYAKKLLSDFQTHKQTQMDKLELRLEGQSQAAKDIQDCEDEIEKIQSRIDEFEDKENELLAEKNGLNTQLKGAKDAAAAEASANIASAESNIIHFKKTENEERYNLHKLIGEYGSHIFISNSMRKLGDLSTQDSEAIFLTDIKSPQREDALKDLLSNQSCICGRDLVPGKDDDCIAKLETEISLATSNEQRTKVNNILIEVNVSLKTMKTFSDAKSLIGDRLKEAKGRREEAEKIKSENEAIRDKCELTADERTAKERIIEIDKTELPPIQSKLRIERLAMESEQKKLTAARTKKGAKPAKKDTKVDDLQDQITEAEVLLGIMNEFTDNEEESIKSKLKESMIHKVKNHGTGDDIFQYKGESMLPKLVSPATGEENPQSEGGDNMKSIFFGTSLVEVSLDRTDTPKFIEPGVAFPFICDAPFSSLDYTNERNATEMITNLDCQIIYLVNPKAYISGIRDILGEMGKEGKRYFVERKVTGKLNNPSEKIKIGKSSYTAWTGETPKEGSEIREVKID